ncbi:MAG: hypothetical protein MZU84_03910 [Sphingobacterium sp.]|nr:hypothetical protein [Sphingobacterium sp.]
MSDDFMILQRAPRHGRAAGRRGVFGQPYYDYYRPLGFVSFAADWTLWRNWPAGYHVTSVLLHLLNTILVFLLARRLVSGEGVGHSRRDLRPARGESGGGVLGRPRRFDLLATAGGIGALLLLGSRVAWRHAGAALLYLAALLSKESVVALPVAAGAYLWLIRRERPSGLVRAFAWLGAAGLVYVWCRQASGLAAAGGAAGSPSWPCSWRCRCCGWLPPIRPTSGIRDWLTRRRGAVMGGAALAMAIAGGVALAAGMEQPSRGALRAFGFAALPAVAGVAGAVAQPAAGMAGPGGPGGSRRGRARRIAPRRARRAGVPRLSAGRGAAAGLEHDGGLACLSLASIPVAIAAAWAMSALTARTAAPATTLLALALIAFGWQVREKGRAWLWASGMTAQAVASIVDATGPGCRGAEIVFVTAPVRTRGVYANINHEALAAHRELPPGEPAGPSSGPATTARRSTPHWSRASSCCAPGCTREVS